jgi:hypothetical protein
MTASCIKAINQCYIDSAIEAAIYGHSINKVS